MSEKIAVSWRAAQARYSRHLAKQGEKLVTFRPKLDSQWDYGIVSLDTNGVVWKGTRENLLNWMREAGVLKPYEEIKEEA